VLLVLGEAGFKSGFSLSEGRFDHLPSVRQPLAADAKNSLHIARP